MRSRLKGLPWGSHSKHARGMRRQQCQRLNEAAAVHFGQLPAAEASSVAAGTAAASLASSLQNPQAS